MGCLLLCFTPMRIIFRLPSSKLAYNCMTMENRWTSQLWRYNTAILLKCVGTTFFHVGGLTWLAAERNGTKCCKNNEESGRVHKAHHIDQTWNKHVLRQELLQRNGKHCHDKPHHLHQLWKRHWGEQHETTTEGKTMPRRNSSGHVKGHVHGLEEPYVLSMPCTN